MSFEFSGHRGQMQTLGWNGEQPEKKRELPPVRFENEGDRLVLPKNFSIDDGIEALQRKKIEDETDVSIREGVNCFPHDGAVALAKVLKRRYGWTNLVPTPTFWGPRPPAMLAVEIAYGERVQVPWGNATVPGIEGTISTSFEEHDDGGMPTFMISGTVKRKHEKIVHEIAEEVRQVVKQESIYRGRAIEIDYRDSDGDRRDFDIEFAPRFLDITSPMEEAIYSEVVTDAIHSSIYKPVTMTQDCIRLGVNLKRGILLGGPYGNGKTLVGKQLARHCANNDWTYVYLKDVRDLDLAIGFAKAYGRCVIFAEDVDKSTAGPRTDQMNRILNLLDGMDTKNLELMVVLTTNHLEYINPAFLRPGRIDDVIVVDYPDAPAMAKIARAYGKDRDGNPIIDGTDEEIMEAMRPILGANAAFIRECVDRSRLRAIGSSDELRIQPQHLHLTAQAMLPQIKLVNPSHGEAVFGSPESGPEVDPMSVAFQIMTQKLAEEFVSAVANPKMLSKIIVKTAKRRGNPSMN